MDDILILGTVISGVVLGLTELVKQTESVPKKYLPVVGVFIGLLAGFFAYPFTELGLEMRLWAGLVAALGATGFFELIKPINKGDEKNGDK